MHRPVTVLGEPALAAGETGRMLVLFDGPVIRDPDGTALAELGEDGCWHTTDGLPCEGLTIPAAKATAHVAPAVRDAAHRAADEAWMSSAVAAIGQLAQQQATLTSDDVWAAIEMPPRQSRMIGNALARAQRAGVIETTEEHRPSVRRENHSRPVRVWRSRLCG
jgi:hypothetical protein